MTNPFRLRWLQGWTFQVVLMGGQVQVEAHGFGICIRSAVMPGESPHAAADRLVLAEDRRRRTLRRAWLRGESLSVNEDSGASTNPTEEPARLRSLVVVGQAHQHSAA